MALFYAMDGASPIPPRAQGPSSMGQVVGLVPTQALDLQSDLLSQSH